MDEEREEGIIGKKRVRGQVFTDFSFRDKVSKQDCARYANNYVHPDVRKVVEVNRLEEQDHHSEALGETYVQKKLEILEAASYCSSSFNYEIFN